VAFDWFWLDKACASYSGARFEMEDQRKLYIVAVELAGHTLQPSTVMEDSVPGTSSEKRAMWS